MLTRFHPHAVPRRPRPFRLRVRHCSLDGDLGGRVAPILASPAFDGIKATDPALDSAMDLVGRINSRSADPILVKTRIVCGVQGLTPMTRGSHWL